MNLFEKNTKKSESFGCNHIKVLGGCCAKCHQLEANVKAALEELGMDTGVELVTDYTQIAAFGVMTTPALVINERVAAFGKVLKKEEIINLLKDTTDLF